MHYIIDYEVCALLFLLVVGVHFFITKRFYGHQNKFFAVFIIIAIFDISLDLITAYTIDNAINISLWINELLLTFFFLVQTVLSALLFIYILVLCSKYKKKNFLKIFLLLIPLVIVELMIIFNFSTDLLFYFDNGSNYIHTSWFTIIYYVTFFYFAISLIAINLYREQISRKQYVTIMIFIALSVGAVLLQKIYPSYLLNGVALALAITMTYLTLQNPADKIDDLTGVFNKSCFMDYVKERLQTAKYSIIIISINDMDAINNIMGTEGTNDTFKEVASFLKAIAKKEYIFRLLDEQFILVTKSKEKCTNYLTKIKNRFEKPWEINNVNISLSMNSVYFSQQDFESNVADILLTINHAMQDSKSLGKGTILHLDKEMERKIRRIIEIENYLPYAVENDLFEVNYQPIYSLKKEKFVFTESLARLTHPKYGLIYPSEFIPLVEKNGLMIKMGEQIINKVCAFIKENKLDDKHLLERVGINLSPVEIMDKTLITRIMRIINNHGIDSSIITFEIVETAAKIPENFIESSISVFEDKGLHLAIDDFGDGYSSTLRIIKLPFSSVKISRNMLLAAEKDRKSLLILANTVELAKKLEVLIIIEGVETKNQLDMLKNLDIDYIQGFYFSHPISGQDLLKLLNTKNKVG